MSCGTCRVTYYCDRACQRCDWKQVHKSVCRDMGGKKCIEEVVHICVRALTLMALSTTGGAFAPFTFTATDPGGLNSIFSFEQHDAVLSAEDTFTVQGTIDSHDNRVCNHFQKKQESARILYPVWETATDTMVFIPISLDFLASGLGAPKHLVQNIESCINNNGNVFYMLVKGVIDGKIGVVGANSWVNVPRTQRKLCQKARAAIKGAK